MRVYPLNNIEWLRLPINGTPIENNKLCGNACVGNGQCNFWVYNPQNTMCNMKMAPAQSAVTSHKLCGNVPSRISRWVLKNLYYIDICSILITCYFFQPFVQGFQRRQSPDRRRLLVRRSRIWNPWRLTNDGKSQEPSLRKGLQSASQMQSLHLQQSVWQMLP